MDDISQTIQTVIFIAFLTLLLAYTFYVAFSRKRKRKIFIVKKRETYYNGLNQTRSKTISCSNYTIDCKYDTSKKIHTLGCSYDIYTQVREGKSYLAYVKMHHIISINKHN